ncbi:hypothetical protein ACFLRR_02055 [Bacteroidota bacterium]
MNNAIDDFKLALERLTYLTHGITDEASRFVIAEKGREVFNNGVITALELFELTAEQEYFDLALKWSMQAKSLSLKWLSEKEKSYESVGLPEDIILELARLRGKINKYVNSDVNFKQPAYSDSLTSLIRLYEKKERLIKNQFLNIRDNLFNSLLEIPDTQSICRRSKLSI